VEGGVERGKTSWMWEGIDAVMQSRGGQGVSRQCQFDHPTQRKKRAGRRRRYRGGGAEGERRRREGKKSGARREQAVPGSPEGPGSGLTVLVPPASRREKMLRRRNGEEDCYGNDRR
jgi:hypothetical protein